MNEETGGLLSGGIVDLGLRRKGKQLILTVPKSKRREAREFKGHIRTMLIVLTRRPRRVVTTLCIRLVIESSLKTA